jgi:hypothetical protein
MTSTHAALGSTLNGQTRQRSKAYAGLRTRRNAEPEIDAKLFAQLTTERDQFKLWWEQSQARVRDLEIGMERLAKGRGLDKKNIKGLRVGSQADLARLWEINSSTVCRLIQQGRITPIGADDNRRGLYDLDQSKPAAKPRGKRKAKNNSGSDGL